MNLSTRAASSSVESSGPDFSFKSQEVDDLLGALAEGVLVAARQHRHRAHAELLQLRHAVRILKHIH